MRAAGRRAGASAVKRVFTSSPLAKLRSRARRTGASEAAARFAHWFATVPATRSDDTASVVNLIVDLIVSTASSASDRALACSVVRCG
eukprot:619583-Pleurochrysis_carterae.AAC.1